ncbi:MAG TPA: adenine deaminase, partial [Firmicutes bacterium]|nr:adenine deaminase [Bacillota bacterium]
MFSQVPTQIKREELVGVALGRDKADVVIKGGQIVSVTSGEVFRADVAIKGERIAMVGDVDHCLEHDTQVIDAHGQYLCPGLMDGHIHIESCMINVTQFARAVVPRGTTAVFLDPHEIANVLGKDGIKLMLDEARRTPLKVFAVVPACVPAANYHLETGAVDFGIDDIDEMLEWPGVVGLGELNDMWRVLDRDYRLHGEIRKALARGMPVDGNAPGYVDRQLNAYIASGIQSDHEAVTMEEATQRLRYGMWLLMREGSTERNLDDLVKVITEGKVDPRHCAFATDDKQAQDLLDEGHIDYA